jgi:hypothetical protein
MVRVARIEVRPSRTERRLALAHGMMVGACAPGGIPLSGSLSKIPGRCLQQRDGADILAVRVPWAAAGRTSNVAQQGGHANGARAFPNVQALISWMQFLTEVHAKVG